MIEIRALAVLLLATLGVSFLLPRAGSPVARRGLTLQSTTPVADTEDTTSVFRKSVPDSSLEDLKMKLLQLSASLDRGQVYNPTTGEQYKENMLVAKKVIEAVLEKESSLPLTLANMDGEWELVISTVPHGIFRSSPFFLAIQQAYADVGKADKAELFFKLHELQTMSWGVSKIGRVAQYIDSAAGTLSSEFDTNIFALTVIPFLGWGKLLPTFGGCVVTESKCSMQDDGQGVLEIEVDYTTAKEVPGLSGLPGGLGIGTKVPVGAIWKLLPWNQQKPPTAKLKVRFVDNNFRIVEDVEGEYFVYTRPVVSRR